MRAMGVILSFFCAAGCGGDVDREPGNAGGAAGTAAADTANRTGNGGAAPAGSTGSSSSSSAASSGSGMGGQGQSACEACSENVFEPGTPCGDALAACGSEPECAKWILCSDHCFDPGVASKPCLVACAADHPSALAHFQPVLNCVCADCADACAAACS